MTNSHAPTTTTKAPFSQMVPIEGVSISTSLALPLADDTFRVIAIILHEYIPQDLS